jgi:hypothetical protein
MSNSINLRGYFVVCMKQEQVIIRVFTNHSLGEYLFKVGFLHLV